MAVISKGVHVTLCNDQGLWACILFCIVSEFVYRFSLLWSRSSGVQEGGLGIANGRQGFAL